MQTVALVTTWEHACGIAEYSKNLVQNCPGFDFRIISYPYDAASIRQRAQGCSLINFQYESGFLGIFSPGVMQSFGMPAVLTLHDSFPSNNRGIYPFTNEADKVIVHEHTDDGFVEIPQPIPQFSDQWSASSTLVGTAGFPLSWKGFPELARAVELVRRETSQITAVRFLAPVNPHCDTNVMERTVRQICGAVEYDKQWNTQDELIRKLSECRVVVYPYRDGKPGISSAVRMGLASRAQIVLTRCQQFKDLFGYEDEIEFCPIPPEPRQIADAILRVLENGKRPKWVLDDMNWGKAGKMYADVYKEVLGIQ